MAQANEQLALISPSLGGRSGTFSRNLDRRTHRWYPYLEGFSADFVAALLHEFGDDANVVHDPFAGTGTTAVVSSGQGRHATYCEVNPFMRLVVEAKTNTARRVYNEMPEAEQYFENVMGAAAANLPETDEATTELASTFGQRKYLTGDRLREVVSIRRAIRSEASDNRDLAILGQLALASIVVNCSELKRAGDLRYRRPVELAHRISAPISNFLQKRHSS